MDYLTEKLGLPKRLLENLQLNCNEDELSQETIQRELKLISAMYTAYGRGIDELRLKHYQEVCHRIIERNDNNDLFSWRSFRGHFTTNLMAKTSNDIPGWHRSKTYSTQVLTVLLNIGLLTFLGRYNTGSLTSGMYMARATEYLKYHNEPEVHGICEGDPA